MADWLKVRHALVRSAKVRALMRELHCQKHVALGVALNWLVWLDEQTEDGLTHLMPKELDEEIGFRGCTEAMISIGWATLGSDGCVEAIEFGKHCGESAKARAENALRQAKHRARHKSNGESNGESNGKSNVFSLRGALPEEKRKEYSNTKVRGSTTVDIEAALPAAPPPPADSACGYGEWLAAMCGCVRAFREARTLHPDVAAAARCAFERFPRAVEYAELLRAYYDDRLVEDRRRKEFWRPQGSQFFRDLEDVVFKHAVRWKQETRWKAGGTVVKKAAVKAAEVPEEYMSEEEKAAAFAAMKADIR